MADMQPNLPAKRKRTQISYAEPEDDLFGDSQGGDIHEVDSENGKSPGDDREHGSRKKMNKRKIRLQKQPHLITSKQSKPGKPFRFLDLPPELRDYIYYLALTEPTGLTLISKYTSLRRSVKRGLVFELDFSFHLPREKNVISPNSQWNVLSPQLLAVSKQIHSEAIGYLYKQPIILTDTTALHTFIALIGPYNRLVLSNVAVQDWGCGGGVHKAMNVASLTSLAACTNLQKLHLDCRIGHLRTPTQLARQIYRDGHYFLEAFGRANGQMDAAVDVLKLNDCNFDRHNCGGRGTNKALPEPEEFKSEFQEEMRRLLLNR